LSKDEVSQHKNLKFQLDQTKPIYCNTLEDVNNAYKGNSLINT
jgi:hypothetical protein